MNISEGGIRLSVDGKEFMTGLPELKNYDATIRTKNHISIISKSKPEEWSNLKKLKKGKHFYEGVLNRAPFRVFIGNDDILRVSVDQIHPILKTKQLDRFNVLNMNQFKKMIPERIIQDLGI